MAIGTPTPASRVKIDDHVISYGPGGRAFNIGRVEDIRTAPNGRMLIVGQWGSLLMRPKSSVRVVG